MTGLLGGFSLCVDMLLSYPSMGTALYFILPTQ